MAKADILVWPGYREAYGMVYLEAASQGIPAVALDNMGVPLVVIDGKTGLLADPEIDGSYRAALERMISNAPLRRKLGEGAARFVREERSAETAAMRLKQIVNQVFAGSGKTG
jgi:glycosyltransferase involved in cell wall biosynthesis